MQTSRSIVMHCRTIGGGGVNSCCGRRQTLTSPSVRVLCPLRTAHVKSVLNKSSRCLHEASRSFVEVSGTSVAGPNTLRHYFRGLQSSDCEEMFTNTLPCFCLPLIGWFGIPCDADVSCSLVFATSVVPCRA